jgi:DNA-binding HxlR family transcriptional regulator
VRSGAQALSLLAVPLNVHLVHALDDEPTALADLRRAVGHPPVTTMRSYLRSLTDLGLIERQRESDFPGSVSYAITDSGRQLLGVAEVLQHWLRSAPEGPVELGGMSCKSAVKALVDGWSAGLVRALAARPLALTELDRLIPQLSYPTLERRLTAMRLVGLVETDPESNGRVNRCRATEWLRYAVAPLTAAASWECRCIPDRASAPGRLDVEAAFLLSVPLLELPPDANGTCRLAAEFRRGSDLEFAGVMVRVEDGELCSCVSRIEGQVDAWASGRVMDWFRCMGGTGESRIELGGDPVLVGALAEALRSTMFPAQEGASTEA